MESETSSTHTLDAATPVAAPAYAQQLPVLGIPVCYESDTTGVLDVVADALGAWRSLDRAPWLVETRGVHIRIVVDDDATDGATWLGSVSDDASAEGRDDGVGEGAHEQGGDGATRPDGERPGAEGGAEEGERRLTRVCARRTLLEDPRQFRHGPVEAVTLALLGRLDRAPVNAGAVGRDGTAVLLVGSSGAGRSTLLYAAARAGLKVLSDERVYVQTRPEQRVWGLPGTLHLPEDAASHFPELAAVPPITLANGMSRLALDVARLNALPESPLARRVGVCLLRRDEGSGSEFARVHPERIMTELRETPAAREAYPDDMISWIGRLAERGAWVLNVSAPPSGLVPRIEAMLDAVLNQPAATQRGEPT